MNREQIKELKDAAFKTKNEQEWADVMQAIKVAVESDDYARQAMRTYCSNLLQKKKEYWKKQKDKPLYQTKPKMLFSESTDAAIGEFFRAATAYLKSLPAFPREL